MAEGGIDPVTTEAHKPSPPRCAPACGICAPYSPGLKRTLLHVASFFVFASGYWALLPLIARRELSGGPGYCGFSPLSAPGAVLDAVLRPRFRARQRGRRGNVHVARGRMTVNGVPLGAGDALKTADPRIVLGNGAPAGVPVFDLP